MKGPKPSILKQTDMISVAFNEEVAKTLESQGV